MISKVTESIIYIGANDHDIDLFEGHYEVPLGMAYNSYVILDEKVCVMDTIDQRKTDEWLTNLQEALAGRKPDYLVVQHMEPDHSFHPGFPEHLSGCDRGRKQENLQDDQPVLPEAVYPQYA